VNHIFKVFLRCEIVGCSPTTSNEILSVGFFADDKIPESSLTRNMPAQIARMFEHCRDPDLPAVFDRQFSPRSGGEIHHVSATGQDD
jgi:hypothetical protein